MKKARCLGPVAFFLASLVCVSAVGAEVDPMGGLGAPLPWEQRGSRGINDVGGRIARSSEEDRKRRHEKEEKEKNTKVQYKRLCIDGLEFIGTEGYGWGQNTTTSSSITQVMDTNGKPKTCK